MYQKLLPSVALLCLFTLFSCSQKEKVTSPTVNITIPSTEYLSTDSSLSVINGILYQDTTPFSGYVIEKYQTKELKLKTPYWNGKKEGEQLTWYANGSLSQLRYYQKGKKTATHTGWWQDGGLKFISHFNAEGTYEGAVEEWFSDGSLHSCFQYENGHQKGLQQMWWKSGKIRANYIIKNGRKYGLSGMKLCRRK